MEPIRAAVGHRIRALRTTRGQSLSELSRESGVAKATLSKIEGGEANPTLDTLIALTTALRVPLGDLLRPEKKMSLIVMRASQGAWIEAGSLKARLVTETDISHARLEMYHGTIGKGAHRSPGHAPGVVEHLFVVDGVVRAGPEGQEVELNPGDYLRMIADKPHIYECVSDRASTFVIMEYPIGGAN